MSRGLPWSVLLHVVVLTVAIVYGNTVQRRVIEPPRYIQARLVTPEALGEMATPPPAEQDEPEAVETLPEPEPEPLPPKEVPETRPEPVPEPEPEKPKPEPRREKPRESAAPTEPVEETEPGPRLTGPSVSATDTDFPFAWYIQRVEGQVARNWSPRQLGFGERSRVSCTVHFVIARGGAISQVTLVRSSGVGVYDREALRAVQATHLPPLPPQYGASTLGITFIFNLEPGM